MNKLNIYDIRELSDKEVETELHNILNYEPHLFEYIEKQWSTNLNSIYDEIRKRDSLFVHKFVDNLYKFIGHHDFMEIEAIVSGPQLRARALLLTLIENSG